MSSWRARSSLTLARIGVIGMAASMPISRALFNLSALCMLVGWLLSGDFGNRWARLRTDAVFWACVLLFGWIAISSSYSTASPADALDQVLLYGKILFVPIIITLVDELQWNRRAWSALVAGLSLTLLVLWLDVWFDIPGTRTHGPSPVPDTGVFQHHIAQGMALAFLAAYALHRAIRSQAPLFRAAWLALTLADVAALVLINESRAGQLSVLVALGLVIVTHTPVRWRWGGAVAAVMLIAGITLSSQNIQSRFQIAWQEAQSFQTNGESTSVGARLKAWEAAIYYVQKDPWLGQGAGAYEGTAHRHFAQSNICQLGVCEQPHNQFVMTLFEAGIPGLLLLLAFLLAPIWSSRKAGDPAARLALPLVGIFLATASFDSSLAIRPQAYFFLTALGVLMASRHQQPK